LRRETLSDPRVLRALNGGWTCILVNADRRPEIRERYQTGTWPVVAFLLPDGKPILSQANPQGKAMPITASYVDADSLLFLLEQGLIYYYRWKNVLQEVGGIWGEREGSEEPMEGAVVEEASDLMARWLIGNADRREGGFGGGPKFVLPWLVEYAGARDARLLPALMEPGHLTIEKIVSSPLYDSGKGGVHRIAMSSGAKRIHEEKMLDKNAYLIRELVFALKTGGPPSLRESLKGTCEFLTRVLARDGGGFYLAQSAGPRAAEDSGKSAETPPPVDRTVIAGPNGLAGAALLRAGVWLDDEGVMEAGREALELVLTRAYGRGRGVDHVIEPAKNRRRYLEAQANTAFALLDAYETTGEERYLRAGRDIVDFALSNLLTRGEKVLRDHIPDPAPMGILTNLRRPMRPNVRLARSMIRLSLHGAGEAYRRSARGILEHFVGDLTRYGVHGIEAAIAVEEMIREPLAIRIEGRADDPEAVRLRRAALNLPWAWTLVTSGPAPEEGGAPVAELSWRGSSVHVGSPEELVTAYRRLTGGSG